MREISAKMTKKRQQDCFWLPLNKHAMNIWLSSLRIRAHLSWRTGKHLHVLHVLRTYPTCSYPGYQDTTTYAALMIWFLKIVNRLFYLWHVLACLAWEGHFNCFAKIFLNLSNRIGFRHHSVSNPINRDWKNEKLKRLAMSVRLSVDVSLVAEGLLHSKI